MPDLVDDYRRIANNTLNKVFDLKLKKDQRQTIDHVAEQFRLEECKERVSMKCKECGPANWQKHTMFTHPLKGLNKELMSEHKTLRPTISQAYIKFAEILCTYPELTLPHERYTQYSFRSLHLCEAPGCFVQSLADFLPENIRDKWLWRANSLMPYHENADLTNMLFEDSFMAAYIEHFLIGPDATGNLLHFNDDYIASFLSDTGKFQLITCDGSFDCTDNPGNQETSVYPLINHAFKITTKCLQVGGCVVFKIYTFCTEDMISLLNQFYSMFERVILHKPAASKPGNSEVYLIGINFNETEEIEPISYELRTHINNASSFFARHQIDMINFNLTSFSKLTQQQRAAIEIKKQEIKSNVINKISVFLKNDITQKPFLRKLEINNHWQQSAWQSAKIKCNDYDEYRIKIHKSFSGLPIKFKTDWPLDLQSNFVITPESLTSILRNKFTTLSSRLTRPNINHNFRNDCSMFADYRLLQFAQNYRIAGYEMSSKDKENKKLRHHFVLRNSQILVDSSFMSKIDWLELCYYTAIGNISIANIFPATRLAVLLPNRVDELKVNSVKICMNSGSTLILNRFSGSVIFFLALFFENVTIDQNGIEFSNRVKVSDELAEYIKNLAANIPTTYDLLQFVPLSLFTNKSIYFRLLEYNNWALDVLLQTEITRRKYESETG